MNSSSSSEEYSSSSSSVDSSSSSSLIEECSGNNPIMSTMFEDDMRSILPDLEQYIVYKQVHYCAIVGDVTRGRNQESIAGFLPSASLEITIINSDFSSLPLNGETITYKDSNYKVGEYLDGADNVTTTFNCESMKDGS